MTESLYGVAMAQDFDVPVEILTPAEFGELWPNAVTDDLVGAVNFPTDGTVNPGHVALALAKGAKDRGARFVQGVTVTGFTRATDGVRVTGIQTDRGTIEAETVVLAAGLWTSELARLAGASVALYPAEHVWVMTEPAEGAARSRRSFVISTATCTPASPRELRDRGVRAERQADGSRPCAHYGFVELGPDWDHFAPVLATPDSACPSWRRSGSAITCGRPRASRPTPRSSWASSPRCPACGWRRA